MNSADGHAAFKWELCPLNSPLAWTPLAGFDVDPASTGATAVPPLQAGGDEGACGRRSGAETRSPPRAAGSRAPCCSLARPLPSLPGALCGLPGGPPGCFACHYLGLGRLVWGPAEDSEGGGGGGHVSGSAGTAWPGSPYASFGALRPPWGGGGSQVITYTYWRCGIRAILDGQGAAAP